jgi:hypothetical protein
MAFFCWYLFDLHSINSQWEFARSQFTYYSNSKLCKRFQSCSHYPWHWHTPDWPPINLWLTEQSHWHRRNGTQLPPVYLSNETAPHSSPNLPRSNWIHLNMPSAEEFSNTYLVNLSWILFGWKSLLAVDFPEHMRCVVRSFLFNQQR